MVFYKIFDLPVHIYTLAGITVSLGIVIDTSIEKAGLEDFAKVIMSNLGVALVSALVATFGIPLFMLPDKVAGSSFALFNKALDRSNFYRQPGRDMLCIYAAMPEGCSMAQLNDVVRNMENYLSLFDQIESFTTNIRSYDNAMIEVAFRPEFEGTPFPVELKSKVISMAADFGSAVWRVWGINDSYFNNSVVTNFKTHNFKLTGYSYPDLCDYAGQLVDYLSQHRRASAPEIMTADGKQAFNEYSLDYDFGRIASMGVSPYNYYRRLSSILYVTSLPPVSVAGEQVPVTLRSLSKDSFDLWNVLNSQVEVDSVAVRLSEIGSVQKKRTSMSIFRRNQSYEIMVGFDFIGSYELAKISWKRS